MITHGITIGTVEDDVDSDVHHSRCRHHDIIIVVVVAVVSLLVEVAGIVVRDAEFAVRTGGELRCHGRRRRGCGRHGGGGGGGGVRRRCRVFVVVIVVVVVVVVVIETAEDGTRDDRGVFRYGLSDGIGDAYDEDFLFSHHFGRRRRS